MNGYSWVSVISISCYLFLLLTFITAKKREKVIKSFMMILALMILWNGGSLGMRMQIWPSVNFWHHVSILGIFTLAYCYLNFLGSFFDESGGMGRTVWLVIYLVLFIFNCMTGFFIPLPEVVHTGETTQFLYHYNWHIYLLFGIVAVTVVQMLVLIIRHCRGNRIAFQQLKPVIVGIAIIFAGHILAALPMFVGLPLDMLSGAVNTLFLFYALYKKKMFRMTILLSRPNYVIMSAVLGVALFSDLAFAIQRLLVNKLEMDNAGAFIVAAVFLVAVIAVIYLIIDKTLTAIFTKNEQKKKNALESFTEEITHMIHVKDILQAMAETIREIIDPQRLYILIRDTEGNFRIEHTLKPLEEKNFYIKADHPVVACIEDGTQCLLQQDFSRMLIYRSLWESEKAMLANQGIECFVSIVSDTGLTGIIMLSGKDGKPISRNNDLNFLKSIAGICAGAVKNAYAYERALEESQKDELTGIINYKFFYEVLEKEFEQHKNMALSLCIFNIDNFKLYNQLHGTYEGDLVLQRVASIMESSINDSCYAARVNGDEFALILPGYDVYSAKCLADTIAEQISNITPPHTSGSSFGRMTVSVGICAAPLMASSAKELYRNADAAVYVAKRTGKNAIQIYSTEADLRSNDAAVYKSGYNEHAGTVYALTAAIDAKDHYTFKHSQNVAYYASELAKAAGMSEDIIEIIKEAGLLHDIGKIGIDEDILNKPERLTQSEYEVMKGHVENAVNIIRHLPSLDYAIPAVYSHHERYDGKGYPRRLEGESIPITGRILCIADSFDAITSTRSYKGAVPVPAAIEMLRAEAGGQFDPKLVDIFIDLIESGAIELKVNS